MAGTALQLGGLTPTQLGFLLGEGVTVVLGLAISYIAYRGYRRNGARPMLFVALGFVGVIGVPALAAAVFVAVPFVTEVHAGVVTQVSEILGMASILYGLRADPG